MTYRARCDGRRLARRLRKPTQLQRWKAECAYYKAHRARWPEGPWDAEPDEVRFTTEAGYPGRMFRSLISGTWNGYVGVPFGHPYWGAREGDALEPDLLAHGGITYAKRAWWDPRDKHWWFGFDTAHASDFMPAMMGHWPETLRALMKYRDLRYVRASVERVAQQMEILRIEADLFARVKARVVLVKQPTEGPPT
jgi:hypothetical protein